MECRIVTNINYSKFTTSKPKSTLCSTLVSMGSRTKNPNEDQQINDQDQQTVAREDTLLFGGISPDQIELLKIRLVTTAGDDMDTDGALRAVLAASAVVIGFGIESSHIYHVLSEYRFHCEIGSSKK